MSAAAFSAFVDAWTHEFTASAAMFTGRQVDVIEARRDEAVPGTAATIWQRHEFSRVTAAPLWIELPAAAVATLAEDGSSDDDAIAIVRELLTQSMQSVAERLKSTAIPGLCCTPESGTGAPDVTIHLITTSWFRVDGQEVPVTLHASEAFVKLIEPSTAVTVSAPAPPADTDMTPLSVLDRFDGVDLPVRVVLGRATLRLRDLLRLTVGSLIELDAQPSSPADICVHDAVLARGEVVSIRGNYGVRVTAVMSDRDRHTLQQRGHGRRPALDAHGRPQRVH